MTTEHESDQFVTATGWRVRGALAESLGERGTPLHPLDEALWGGSFRIHGRGSQPADELVMEALAAYLSEVNETEVDLSQELVIEGRERSGLFWTPSERGGILLARHPHPAFARTPCITHLQLHTLGGQTTLRIRVGAEDGRDSMRGPVGAAQLVPPWMTALMDRAHYTYQGGVSRVLELDERKIPGFVERHILDPGRRFPLAILSPLEEGGYLVDHAELARELLGVAHLYRVPQHQDTFTLSDSIRDRRLSAFWGALRIYLPGFSRDDHPHTHPLLLPERLTDPLMRASEFGGLLLKRAPLELEIALPEAYLAVQAAAEASAREEEEARAREASMADAQAEVAPRAGAAGAMGMGEVDLPEGARPSARTDGHVAAAAPSAPVPDRYLSLLENQQTLLADLRRELRAQQEKLDAVDGTVRGVHEEIEQMRTRMEMGSADVSHNSRQLDRVLSHLRSLLPAPEGPEDADLSEGAQSKEKVESSELLEAVRGAREKYPDDLAILDSAEASARESDFHDPAMVETILGVMAEVSRQRQEGLLGRGLKVAFRDYGLTYQSSISRGSPERIRRQHDFTDDRGQVHFCEEHISQGNAYDSRYCLRIYFTSKSPREPRFVVGHVGKHLETVSTT